MALAHLAHRGQSGGNVLFDADTGTNPYFLVKVGRSKRRYGGIEFVDEEGFVSPISRRSRSNDVFGTEFVLPVPEAAFAGGNRYVQLWSYRTADRTGPAVSDVLLVHVAAPRRDAAPFLPSAALAIHPFIEERKMRYSNASYHEEGISESMFWSTLINALPQLVEQAVPVVSGLLGERRSNGSSSSGDAGTLVQTIADLIKQITGDGAPSAEQAPATAAPAEAPATAEAAPASQNGATSMSVRPRNLPHPMAEMAGRYVSPDTMQIMRDDPRQMGMVLNDSVLRLSGRPRVNYPYAEAKVAWAPIIAAVAPYVKDILEIGNKADADQRRHLERLVELLNDPSLTALMATLSTARAPKRFKPDTRIHIDTDALPRVRVRQKDRVLYARGAAARIPFRLATNRADAPVRPIPRVIVQATIQDAGTMAVLWEKEFKLKDVVLNTELRAIEILPEESEVLPANVDLKLEITARWQGKDNRTVFGTMKNQFITLVDDVVFDEVGEKVGETILLNDVVEHRPYWHKVWEGGYSESRRWHIEFDARYFYAVDTDADEPSRLETRVMVVEDNATAGEEMPDRRKVRARLKAGMELTIPMLARLCGTAGHPEPTSDELRALRHSEFQSYLNQVARVHLEMKGKSGDTGTLWVYPEVNFHRIRLLRVSQTNKDGQVLGMTRESLIFPRPSSLHFIGTTSE